MSQEATLTEDTRGLQGNESYRASLHSTGIQSQPSGYADGVKSSATFAAPPTTSSTDRNIVASTANSTAPIAAPRESVTSNQFENQPTSNSTLVNPNTSVTSNDNIPGSRNSALLQPDASAGLPTSIGKQNKPNLLTKRRQGSATSDRARGARNASVEKPVQSGTSPATAQLGSPKKKSGFAKFLSALCCGAFDSADSGEKVEAPRPFSNQQAVPQPTQSMAQNKATESQTESGTADSKEDELLTNTSHPLGSSTSEKQTSDMVPPGGLYGTKQNIQQTGQEIALPSEKSLPEKPLPASPTAPVSAGPYRVPSPPQAIIHEYNTPHTPLPQDALSLPTPTVTHTQVFPDEDQEISDRTSEQEKLDTDIEMTDAGPSVPLASHEVPTLPTQTSTAQTPASAGNKVNIPPPPPASERQVQIAGQPSRAPQLPAVAPVEPPQKWLLPPLTAEFRDRKCLVLDLDETLVHASFKILHQADFTIPVEIEGQYHNVYVIKRPGVDQFMKRMGELFEVVVFTASVSKYGDPLLDQLDIHHVISHRLFRESCYNHHGNYVKDLSQVGRDLRETIIIDNSPTSYIFHPQHAVPISSWFSDAHDNELIDLIPVLEDLAGDGVRDVSLVLDVGL